MANGTKMYTIDKFLGINEGVDGYTELQMGEASAMENFLVTDGYNLAVRPGVVPVDLGQRQPAPILAAWSGHVADSEYLVLCDFFEGKDRLLVYEKDRTGLFSLIHSQSGVLGITKQEGNNVQIFPFSQKLYVRSLAKIAAYEGGKFTEQEPYVPLVIAGAAPAGGGTTLENINLLTPLRRIDYSADGTSTAYVLPGEAVGITALRVDNVDKDIAQTGSFDTAKHTYTFKTAPTKGVGNVEFTYTTDQAAADQARGQVLSCRLSEEYNGSTDTRLFFGGNGTNTVYYSGVTQQGEPSAMYFPAMNEVAVDISGAMVTGLVRHYGKLLVFKSDGAYTISYEPVTLTDGKTIAGFYLRSMNREYGNAIMGQVQTVQNYPRSITKDGIYEWRITSSYYKDERYAVRISDVVEKSLQKADLQNIVTCDDDYSKTYYVFLNDEQGTVLVNRYALGKHGTWCIYRGECFKNIRWAMMHGSEMIFLNSTQALRFSPAASMDTALDGRAGTVPIKALWESGYMDFGADFLRKYSSLIYVSMLPEGDSNMTITAATDKRMDYTEKTLGASIFDFSNLNFGTLTFDTNNTPKIRKVKLKVKKFVYYKMIFRVDTPGSRATVLSIDQEVRFASKAK